MPSSRTIVFRLICFLVSLYVIFLAIPFIGPLTALIAVVIIITFMITLKDRGIFYPYKNRNDMVVQQHMKAKSSSKTFSCPSCGKSVLNDDFFCQNCGQKVI